MDVDILNDNGMEEEYIRKSFIVPNVAIKVACFKAGMTEEDYYNTLGECRMYGDNKEKNEEYQRELCRKILEGLPIKIDIMEKEMTLGERFENFLSFAV